jgi:hypothetical protein
MAKWLKITLAVGSVLAILGGGAAYILWPVEYVSTQTVEHTFTIDDDFTHVRKIFVHTNAVKRIIGLTNSEFVDQDWFNKHLSLEGILRPSWSVTANGRLQVETNNDYIGHHLLTLSQNCYLNRDVMRTTTQLVKGTDRLRGYEQVSEFSRAGGQTQVTVRLTLEIKADVPSLAKSIVNRRVRAAAEESLAKTEQSVRKIVADNANEHWLL